MIEDDRYCIDILTQLGAVSTALEAVALKVLEEHVQHCVAGALASGDPDAAEEKSRELLEAVQRLAKTPRAPPPPPRAISGRVSGGRRAPPPAAPRGRAPR